MVGRLVAFRDARDWSQFHTIKDLALSVCVEASELLELTQWKTEEELARLAEGEGQDRFSDEIADVLIYLLLLCEKLQVDPLTAVAAKIDRNEKRFPKVAGISNA